MISTYCKVAVGVDKSEVRLSQARDKYKESHKNLTFHVIDAFDIAQIRNLGPFSVIFIDISGNAKLESLLPLITAYSRSLQVCHTWQCTALNSA